VYVYVHSVCSAVDRRSGFILYHLLLRIRLILRFFGIKGVAKLRTTTLRCFQIFKSSLKHYYSRVSFTMFPYTDALLSPNRWESSLYQVISYEYIKLNITVISANVWCHTVPVKSRFMTMANIEFVIGNSSCITNACLLAFFLFSAIFWLKACVYIL